LSTISPFLTITIPTLQTLERLPLAVSKSMAAKSVILIIFLRLADEVEGVGIAVSGEIVKAFVAEGGEFSGVSDAVLCFGYKNN
jgi:hypothetical protein